MGIRYKKKHKTYQNLYYWIFYFIFRDWNNFETVILLLLVFAIPCTNGQLATEGNDFCDPSLSNLRFK